MKDKKTKKPSLEEPSVIDNGNKQKQPVTTSKLEQEEIYLVELENSNSTKPPSKIKPPKKKSTSKPPIKNTKLLPTVKRKPSTKKNQTKALSSKTTPSSTLAQPAAIDYLINPKDDQDLKELFIYLDELLSHLPKKNINQFANSKYYAKYMELLKKLKI